MAFHLSVAVLGFSDIYVAAVLAACLIVFYSEIIICQN